ncbi:hypothetical protein GCM10008090_03630 [Arenicella chitinivorans]|uniref:DUF2914 domain-containing protein n=1 Tax=Arenicella chitinivorans TaxID=1329800 RepID=A0A918VG37_9GAMM|nr:hypothetical protein [Arenicella chitinivorans]GGZ98435.1 hypothetical protein GCM10008090_03630 [Arenicella chitinivorans]
MDTTRLKLQLKAIIAMMAFLVSGAAISQDIATEPSDVKPDQQLYFTLPDEHAFPQADAIENFDCSDKIYSVITLSNFPKGKFHIAFIWTDPAGTDRERTEYPFYVREDEEKLWAWLQLSRATGAGMLQWINPAAGLEEFIGPWHVTVEVDGKKVASGSFDVSC